MIDTRRGFTNVLPRNSTRTALALKHLKRLKAQRLAYEEEVDAWYRSGDGRSPNWRTEVDGETGEVYQWNAGGRGYRFPECIHGSSLWTDYDNICGPCEDGLSEYDIALRLAHDDWHTFEQRMAVVRQLQDVHAPESIREDVLAWALDGLGLPKEEK